MKDKKILYGIIIAFIFLFSIGITYAYFSIDVEEVEGEPKDIITSTGTLSLLYTDGPEIKAEDILPTWTTTKTVSVENTGSFDAYYALTWASLTNTFERDELVLSATCISSTGTCEGIEETPVASGDIISNIIISPGITHTYTITFKFIETSSVQNYNQGAVFNGVINVIESKP